VTILVTKQHTLNLFRSCILIVTASGTLPFAPLRCSELEAFA